MKVSRFEMERPNCPTCFEDHIRRPRLRQIDAGKQPPAPRPRKMNKVKGRKNAYFCPGCGCSMTMEVQVV